MHRLVRPDSIFVWNKDIVRQRFNRYYDIMNDQRVAKFLITKNVKANVDLSEPTPKLWSEHDKISAKFPNIIKQIDEDREKLQKMDTPNVSYLDLKMELVKRMLEECIFCERRCKVNRSKGEKGHWCQLDNVARVSSAFLHHGEEAPLVPSGTIFFSSCSFKCVFCQNYDISTQPENGVEVTSQKLASLANHLKREGARNINFVGGDPTPSLHVIVESLKDVKVNVTMLWNSNQYCSKETMKILLDVIDFWLPDFKYGSDDCAKRLSKAENYFEIVSRNHKMPHDQGGGEMIIRHLVLPNHIECCTRPILEWIAENSPKAMVNIMGQYRPMHLVYSSSRYSDIARHPTSKEMDKARRIADDLGLVWGPVS